MKCLRCYEELYDSGTFSIKDSEAVTTISCYNIECAEFAREMYLHSKNLYIYVNRQYENMSVKDIVDQLGLSLDKSTDIEAVVIEYLKQFPEQAATHKSKKKDLSGFFVGRIMKENQALDPKLVKETVMKVLSE